MADDGLVRNITTRIDGAVKHFNCEKNLHNFARSRLLNGRGGGGVGAFNQNSGAE